MKRKTVYIDTRKHFAFLEEECDDKQHLINIANELGVYENLMEKGYKLVTPNGRSIKTFQEVIETEKSVYGFNS